MRNARKYIAGAVLALGLFATPFVSSAAGLSTPQVKSIIELLTAFEVDPQTIARVMIQITSASIDQKSLVTSDRNPVITGTAIGVDSVQVGVSSILPGVNFGGSTAVPVPVINDRWSVTLSPKVFTSPTGLFATSSPAGSGRLPYGAYTVFVGGMWAQLAVGTLSIVQGSGTGL